VTHSLYTSETMRWRLSDVTLNDAAVNNTTNAPDTFTYDVRDNHGASLANTGNFAYDTTAEAWDAVITLPATAGRYHLHAAITKGSSAGFFHESIVVQART